jgi:hypothetical protein
VILTKKDLGILNLYASCADSRHPIGKNFRIESLNGKIRFSQVTDNSILFTDLDFNSDNKFNYNYPTQAITQFLKTCGDDDKIEFIDNAIKMSNNAEYKFESIDYTTSFTNEMFDEVVSNFNSKEKLTVKDLNKINYIKGYIGNDAGVDAVALINSHFIATDKRTATACIKTENKNADNFFMSNICTQILTANKFQEVNFLIEEDKYIFKIEDTFVVLSKEKYIIPDLFTEEIKSCYNFENKVKVNQSEILLALNRINIFAKENINNRIFFTLKENEIVIESKDKGYAIEKVNAVIDTELINHYHILSATNLINAISLINTNDIIIKIMPSKESNVISVFPAEHEDMFVILNVLDYID